MNYLQFEPPQAESSSGISSLFSARLNGEIDWENGLLAQPGRDDAAHRDRRAHPSRLRNSVRGRLGRNGLHPRVGRTSTAGGLMSGVDGSNLVLRRFAHPGRTLGPHSTLKSRLKNRPANSDRVAHRLELALANVEEPGEA